jgi:hypothetical protein
MGNERGGSEPDPGGEAVGRRAFLRKAAVAGTGAVAVPMIVTVDPADAQALTSPPPEPPGASTPTTAPTGPAAPPTTPQRVGPTGRRVTGRTELPRTGADIDRMAAAGLAATAGGAALVLWSAEMKSNAAVPAAADPVAPRPADPQPPRPADPQPDA